MTKIRSIGDSYTPAEIAESVPWDKIKRCVTMYIDEDDGTLRMHCTSALSFSDFAWMIQTLQAKFVFDSEDVRE